MYSTGFSKRKMNNKIAIFTKFGSLARCLVYIFKIYMPNIPHTLSQVHAWKYINAMSLFQNFLPKTNRKFFDKNQFSWSRFWHQSCMIPFRVVFAGGWYINIISNSNNKHHNGTRCSAYVTYYHLCKDAIWPCICGAHTSIHIFYIKNTPFNFCLFPFRLRKQASLKSFIFCVFPFACKCIVINYETKSL